MTDVHNHFAQGTTVNFAGDPNAHRPYPGQPQSLQQQEVAPPANNNSGSPIPTDYGDYKLRLDKSHTGLAITAVSITGILAVSFMFWIWSGSTRYGNLTTESKELYAHEMDNKKDIAKVESVEHIGVALANASAHNSDVVQTATAQLAATQAQLAQMEHDQQLMLTLFQKPAPTPQVVYVPAPAPAPVVAPAAYVVPPAPLAMPYPQHGSQVASIYGGTRPTEQHYPIGHPLAGGHRCWADHSPAPPGGGTGWCRD